MRARSLVALAIAFAARGAQAAPNAEIEKVFRTLQQGMSVSDIAAPRFAMTDLESTKDGDLGQAYIHLGGLDSEIDRISTAVSTDGKAAWVGSDIRFVGDCGGSGSCGKTFARNHFTGVFERTANGWQPVAWNMAVTNSAARQARMIKDGDKLDEIATKVDGADGAVAVFSASLADPKALAATVSPRKDVLLYGSEDGERVVGGAQVKAKLTGWKLAFKVHDGIRAGVAATGSVAWVAANLDATPVGRDGAKPTPYRVLFVYELGGETWRLVSAQFSFGRI